MNTHIPAKDLNSARSPAGGRDLAEGTPIARRTPPSEADWHAGSGIIDQMVAYRDWWNLPVRRPLGQSRAIR